MAARLVVRVGEERIALPAEAVREVVPLGRTTRVPLAPPALLGLGTVRGAVMPVVSLAALLDQPADGGGRMIVLDRDEPVALAVEGVPRLVRGEEDARLIDVAPLLAKRFPAAEAPKASTRARGAATAGAEPMAEGEKIALLVLAVAGQSFALPLDRVEELIAVPDDIAWLPGGDAVAIGSVEYRGALLPLLSLSGLLGLEGGMATRPRILVVAVRGSRIGLLVDGIDAVLRVAEAAIDGVPAVLARGRGEARIQAIVRRPGGGLVSLLAPEHLLAAEMAGRLRPAAAAVVPAGEESVEESETVLLFRLGDESFALPVAAVREVVAMPDRLTRLPRAPAFVEGVMNRRGRAVPVIDQRRRFGLGPAETGRRRIIIVAIDDLEAGFAVDAVTEVRRVPASRLRPAPPMGEEARLFDRVAGLDDGERIALVIAPRDLLDRAERDLLAAMAQEDMAPRP